MVFPVWAENFQVKYVNPMIKPFSRFVPGIATVKHRGRRSGKPYETIITAYRKGNVLAIALVHGKTDWVKNVLAADGCEIRTRGRSFRARDPRVYHDEARRGIRPLERHALGLIAVSDFLSLTIER